ncbi:MAG: transposase [Actinomycetota bacterium]|nr:transposase [Actinomycetota bacterium]
MRDAYEGGAACGRGAWRVRSEAARDRGDARGDVDVPPRDRDSAARHVRARISVGSIDTILKQCSEALKAPWETIQRAVQAADVAHADETSWRKAGQRLWLWAAFSASAACYRIDPTRARPAAKALLGSFSGLLICDRYSVYDFIDPSRRQACLAHLARNYQAFAERPGACGQHGQQIRAVIDEVIRADTKARGGGHTIAWHTGPLNDIHNRLMDAIQAGERSRTPCRGRSRASDASGTP